jgi:hypothetical protein
MLTGQPKYKMAWALSQITSKHRVDNGRRFEVSRKVLSEAATGIPKTEEWKKLMSVRNKGENNPMHRSKGRRSPLKDLTPEKRSELGKKGAAASWKKWQEAGYSRPPGLSTPESIAKMKATKIQQAAEGMLWVQSEEGRKRASERSKGKKRPPEQGKKSSKALAGVFLMQFPNLDKKIIVGLYRAGKDLGFDGPNIVTYGKSKGYLMLDRDFELSKYEGIEVLDYTLK